jgi:hypothetical protein
MTGLYSSPIKTVTASVYCIYTTCLAIKNSTYRKHTAVFMCSAWMWEQTAIISLHSINGSVFIIDFQTIIAQWLLYVPPLVLHRKWWWGCSSLLFWPANPPSHFLSGLCVILSSERWSGWPSLFLLFSFGFKYRTFDIHSLRFIMDFSAVSDRYHACSYVMFCFGAVCTDVHCWLPSTAVSSTCM